MNTTFIKSHLDQEMACHLYQCMRKIRLTEQKIAEIYPTDKIQSPVHLCVGQEAVSAGVGLTLQREDHLYGTYRNHGIFIAKGGNLKSLFAELYGKDTGCARGKGGSMHLVAPEMGLMGSSAIVASTIPVATGDALAAKMQRSSRVVVAFFGDGAVDEGVFFESINFAVLKKLPIIYVCENNHYAIHSKVADRHRQQDLYRIGESLGVRGFRYDGNDTTAVYAAMADAVKKIREGGEPILLEFMTYRWLEHVGIALDHHEAYRDKEKMPWVLQNDPISKMKRLLETQFGIHKSHFNAWEETIKQEIQAAVLFAEESPFPEPQKLFENVYAEKYAD